MTTASELLTSRLEPGERLIWSGRPKQGIRLQASDAIMIPFSVMWGGFALFWEAGVSGLIRLDSRHPQNQPPLFMVLWGIPFVCVGLYMMIGRFFYDSSVRKETIYAVTDRRAIVLKNFLGFNLVSFDLASATNLNLIERRDGSGDIIFGAQNSFILGSSGGWPSRRGQASPGFYLLENGRQIYSLILETQSVARRR